MRLQHSSESSGESTGHSATGWSSGSNEGESTSYSVAARDLLTPDEVMDLGTGTAILLAPGGRPHVLHPVPYWKLEQTFAGYPGAYPVVYYDRNLSLDPGSRQCAPMPPPVPEQYRNFQSQAPPESAPVQQPERPRAPIDYGYYSAENIRKREEQAAREKQPHAPETPNPWSAVAAPQPEETRSGSTNYDPNYYSDENIRKRAEQAAREKKPGTPETISPWMAAAEPPKKKPQE